ncbi:MAG: ATP-grasp domain-containing protein [Planctomycetota bacterium]|nr:ATP-grasp domain-containing protein [Planctomycetota bacterium]
MTATSTVMIIGGGRWQLPLIQRAIALGLRTVVTDRNPDAPGRSCAHVFRAVDMHDAHALLSIARREAVDLVISDQTDRAVPVVAALNDALGRPGIRPDVALRFTDKRIMRSALRDAGVPLPRHRTARSCSEACDAARSLGYPVVIKPVASQSSVGVFCIHTEDLLRRRFDDCLTRSRDVILVEEYIAGPELTVEGLALGGRHHVLAVSEKAHYADLPCVARRLAYPTCLNGDTLRSVHDAACVVARTLGLVDGLTHAEFRLRAGAPYLIEVAARGGGHGVASTIVPHVSGVDPYILLLRRLLGDSPADPSVASRAAVLEFFRFPPGRVRAVHGAADARRRRLAHVLDIPYRPGDTITSPTDDTDRGAYFIALDETRDRVEARAARLRQLIHVEYA